MNNKDANKKDVKQLPRQQEIDRWKSLRKIRASWKLILTVCGVSAIIGLVIASGIPKEYTARIFLVPENSRRSAFAGISALSGMVGTPISSSVTERDAIYSVLYPDIIYSTPFLVRLFDVEVRGQKDSAAITLAQYLRERQKSPWWSVITSAPSRLTGGVLSLFREKPEEKKVSRQTDVFQLTPVEAGTAAAIASRIGVKVNETSTRRGKITLSVTMQDPLVAATVADTVLEYLKQYVTEYRTGKVRRMLEYTKKLREETWTEYCEAQEKYTRYADSHRGLAMTASRAELARLRDEMNLARASYNRAELQVQVAEAKVQRMIPVLAVIQPAVVPLSPSKPRKMVILAVCILLGGAGSVAWVLFGKEFLNSFKEAWKKEGEKDKEKGNSQ